MSGIMHIEMTTFEWANYYVFKKGFSVIPLTPNDKSPAINTWKIFQTHKPTNDNLKAWFDNSSQNNIGIVAGAISGLAVIDLDSQEAVEFAKKNNFPQTPLIKTGKGYHLYYKYKEGVRNFQKRDDLPGIDLRGDGGYVVAPPSIHPSGHQYQWVKGKGLDDIPIAELPEIILAKSPDQKTPLKELYQGVPDGQRNDSLTRLVGSWVNDGLSYDECLEFACLWNSKNDPPETDQRKIERTVRSIFETHHRAPSQLHGTIYTHETVKLKISTLQDILDYEDPIYLIDRILIENTLTLLSGYAGAYKSLLSEFMAFSILTGQKLFGHFNVSRKGGVLIVDEENPGAFLKERVVKIGFTNNLPISFLHFQRVKIDNPNCFAELIQVIKDIKPILVIFDALIRIHNRKENETEMALVMERLRDIVNLGVTVLLIHHHRKGAGDKRESVRGSSDILAGVDIHLSVEEKENYIVLSSPKSRTKTLDSIRLKLEATDDLLAFRYIGAELNENQIVVNEIAEILQGGIKIGVKEILGELKNKDYEIGQNRLREILQGATGKELAETTGDRGKKLYSLNSTFTVSRGIYIPVNCETEKDQVNDLHSFTEAPSLNCETNKQETRDLEDEKAEIVG